MVYNLDSLYVNAGQKAQQRCRAFSYLLNVLLTTNRPGDTV
jgi:hypothetical protein